MVMVLMTLLVRLGYNSIKICLNEDVTIRTMLVIIILKI